MPNELKLMFADKLETHDVSTLASTCREMNNLLLRFMYRRAKDSTAECGRSYFLLAVDVGNLTAVERFIEVGASVNMTDRIMGFPETAIHSCAYYGHVEIAEFLINKGIDVSFVDSVGNRAMHSVLAGVNPKEAMMTLLVEAGADMTATWNSHTPLHEAAATGNIRMVQCLLELGADTNAADPGGLRPVHVAAGYSNGATVRCLLEAGQDIEIADNLGRTPLHAAVEGQRIENVKVLLEMGADASSVDRRGWTPLLYAVYLNGNEASIHRILHLGASMADQPREIQMYEAETDTPDCVPSCQLEEPNDMIVEMLLAAGADITMLDDESRRSPLRWAAARAQTTCFGPQGA